MALTAEDTARLNRAAISARSQSNYRAYMRAKAPWIRLWDGDWDFIGTADDVIEGSFEWKLNDTGGAHLIIPLDSWLAKKLRGFYKRKTARNIHVTMDKDGARWSGRMDSMNLRKLPDGQRELELHFLHDYEELKHVLVWPNPFLPDAVQFPRAYTTVGPACWTLKMALFLNLWRLHGDFWKFNDDPLDYRTWTDKVNPLAWPIQVKPDSIAGDGTPWVVLSSRMKTWHELAKPILDDAHLSVECRRWLEGDPPLRDGALIDLKPRNGALIVDIVDKSGYWNNKGTALIGNVFTGMVRTAQNIVNDVETQHTIMPNPNSDDMPLSYKVGKALGTVPTHPYVTYREGPITGIESSDFSWQPATATQTVVGGHSAYGVNEAISSAITLAGNYMGMFVLLPTAGVIADNILKPIYADTILAWNAKKHYGRARELGWSRYNEHFSDGADKAYTINAVWALRKGFWETREQVSHKLDLQDGAPWFIGQEGLGHFFLGDRIGATIAGLSEEHIVVEQVTAISYDFNRDNRGWRAVCGALNAQQSPLERVAGKVGNVAQAVHQLGVI